MQYVVSDEDAEQVSVEFLEHLSFVCVSRDEPDSKEIPLEISRNDHFEAVTPAFCGVSPRGESAHGPMTLRILRKPDWHISGVGMLHEMGILTIGAQEKQQYEPDVLPEPVEVHDQGLVMITQVEDIGQGFFTGNVLSGSEDAKGDDVNDGDEEFATFSEFELFKI